MKLMVIKCIELLGSLKSRILHTLLLMARKTSDVTYPQDPPRGFVNVSQLC